MGDTARTGGEGPELNAFPKPMAEEATAEIGDTTAARPPGAAGVVAGEGEAELGLG